MKRIMLSAVVCSIVLMSCDFSSLFDSGSSPGTGLSENEIISGLKEALILGSKTAAFTLSDTSGATNVLGEVTGYMANELVRIALPQDVENALKTVDLLNETAVGQNLLNAAGINLAGYRQAMILGLNRGAENAAGLSIDVFKTAVTEMTFLSAKQILFGQDSTGATSYLKTTTSDVLTTGFKPIIDNSFSKVQVSAFGTNFSVKGIWSQFALNYNKVSSAYQTLKLNASSGNPLTSVPANISLTALQKAGVDSVTSVNTNLTDFATEKALNGLFFMVGRQEIKIRQDPMTALAAAGEFITDTISDLIEKVFTSKS